MKSVREILEYVYSEGREQAKGYPKNEILSYAEAQINQITLGEGEVEAIIIEHLETKGWHSKLIVKKDKRFYMIGGINITEIAFALSHKIPKPKEPPYCPHFNQEGCSHNCNECDFSIPKNGWTEEELDKILPKEEKWSKEFDKKFVGELRYEAGDCDVGLIDTGEQGVESIKEFIQKIITDCKQALLSGKEGEGR